ncbi:MAG: response regulator, partial [Candidatus Hydrogenedentota bacterium]
CFADPMEALEQMAKEKPHLVITDLMMKFIDTGFVFSRQIKFDPRFKDIPIILVTAAFSKREFALQPGASGDLEKMGVDAYFDKPVPPSKLLEKVRELLGRHAEEQGK